MKTNNRFIVAIVLVAVATLVAVVSCRKETQANLPGNSPQPVKTFSVPEVEDMNAYLKEFKQKMQTVTRGDNETLGLEEAAWYLSSVANYDFANANVEFNNLRYDTLRYQIDVTDGQVTMSDLNAAYQTIANGIDGFYHSLNLDNKHFRFIGADISENGEIAISLITTYMTRDNWWYFLDSWVAGVTCDSLFSDDITYIWNGNGKSVLEDAINLLEGKPYITLEYPPVRTYYVYTMSIKFNYDQYTDPYGSDFIGNSRIYACLADTYATPTISANNMCYCLDSYLGLPSTYIHSHPNMGNQLPVNWHITCKVLDPYLSHWHRFVHIVTVKFGRITASETPNEY